MHVCALSRGVGRRCTIGGVCGDVHKCMRTGLGGACAVVPWLALSLIMIGVGEPSRGRALCAARGDAREIASIGGVSGGSLPICSMASTPYLYFSTGTKGLCVIARAGFGS